MSICVLVGETADDMNDEEVLENHPDTFAEDSSCDKIISSIEEEVVDETLKDHPNGGN